jgi:hypothetical protein
MTSAVGSRLLFYICRVGLSGDTGSLLEDEEFPSTDDGAGLPLLRPALDEHAEQIFAITNDVGNKGAGLGETTIREPLRSMKIKA